jgi:hypothetical protein
MDQADSVHSTPPINTSKTDGEFSNLAAAVSPAWHQAIIRLANVSEKVAAKLGWVLEHDQDNDPASVYVKNCRELVDLMLEFLDGLQADPDLEETADDEPSLGWPATGHCGGIDDLEADPENDEDGDPAEPSLGSIGDMHLDQTRWATGGQRDLEQDGAESGIGDQDGLDEQVPFRDWQGVGMV